ncbi:hypothetical protein KP509_24G059100 [Ceratopteris richardii]|uniref:Uncharacterized protein n=1 Tax=Ceratopteris richardii TaxID=49495 RepID=A0A8T2RWY3_CERRI|nr:hypothetical protein KP509_24G059100 [Ceratopteris richardii]
MDALESTICRLSSSSNSFLSSISFRIRSVSPSFAIKAGSVVGQGQSSREMSLILDKEPSSFDVLYLSKQGELLEKADFNSTVKNYGFSEHNNKVNLLKAQEVSYEGAINDPHSLPLDAEEFVARLRSSLLHWKAQEDASHLDLSEADIQIIQAERLRRRRISEANKNKVRRNKDRGRMKGNDCEDMGTNHKFIGTQFKEKEIKTLCYRDKATSKRANYRAMKRPEVREKLRIRSTKLSNETKSKIKATMERRWQERKMLKSMQEACVEEWKEYVADSARRGLDQDIVYCWDSYTVIMAELRNAWKSKKTAVYKQRQVSSSSAHEINDFIAVMADIDHQCSETDGSLKSREGQVQEQMKNKRRCRGKSRFSPEGAALIESKDLKVNKSPKESSRESKTGVQTENLVPKGLPRYKNPLCSAMLEKIKRTREERLAKERTQRQALKRARTLMENAEAAANILKAQAKTDDTVLLFLQDVQQLLSEAEVSLNAAI